MAVVPNTLFPCVQQSLCEIPTQQSVCRIFRNGTLSRMTKWHQPTQETGTVRGLTFYRRQWWRWSLLVYDDVWSRDSFIEACCLQLLPLYSSPQHAIHIAQDYLYLLTWYVLPSSPWQHQQAPISFRHHSLQNISPAWNTKSSFENKDGACSRPSSSMRRIPILSAASLSIAIFLQPLTSIFFIPF